MFLRCTILAILLTFITEPAAEDYVIGVERQDYYPHYDFVNNDRPSFASDLFALFATHSGHRIVLLPLPIKRARQELLEGEIIDLMYPDNPAWAEFQSADKPRLYSQPVVRILGGTMVRPQTLGQDIEKFRVLAVPRGFTPIEWLKLDPGKGFRVVEVPDALSALEMVLKQRADGADVEFNVARHLLSRIGQGGMLVMDPTLPYSSVGFHLSTLEYPQLLEAFDRFLIERQADIEKLKQDYGLIEQLALLPNQQE